MFAPERSPHDKKLLEYASKVPVRCSSKICDFILLAQDSPGSRRLFPYCTIKNTYISEIVNGSIAKCTEIDFQELILRKI